MLSPSMAHREAVKEEGRVHTISITPCLHGGMVAVPRTRSGR